MPLPSASTSSIRKSWSWPTQRFETGWLLSQVWDRFADRALYSSQQAVRNFGEGARHFCDLEKLIAAVNKELGPETTVLVKGSRFMKMERVADAIVSEEKD